LVFGVEFSEENIVNRRLPLALGLVPTFFVGLMLSCSAGAAGNAGDTGWYAGGEIGVDISTTQNFNQNGTGVQNSDNTGFLGGFNGGWLFANGLRAELAFDYHYASVGSIQATAANGISSPIRTVSGAVSAATVLGSVLYDFKQPDGFFAVIYPYVLAGVGVADVGVRHENFTTFQETMGSADGSKMVLAYQFGFGGAWDLDSNWSALAGFRYLLTSDVSIKPSGSCTSSSTNVCGISGIYRAPSLFLGLRYKFGGSES